MYVRFCQCISAQNLCGWMYHPELFLPSYACSVGSMEVILAEEKVSEEWEVVDSLRHIEAWRRMLFGIFTLSRLRKFWGSLGHYLQRIKRRGLGN